MASRVNDFGRDLKRNSILAAQDHENAPSSGKAQRLPPVRSRSVSNVLDDEDRQRIMKVMQKAVDDLDQYEVACRRAAHACDPQIRDPAIPEHEKKKEEEIHQKFGNNPAAMRMINTYVNNQPCSIS